MTEGRYGDIVGLSLAAKPAGHECDRRHADGTVDRVISGEWTLSNSSGIKLSSFFSEKHVLCGLEGVDRDECLRRLVGVLADDGRIARRDDTVEAVILREQLLSTQLAAGLAIPHTRLEDIKDLTLAVATSRSGIDFGGGGESLAHIVVLILTPVSQPGLYLQTLAAIANLFSKKDLVERVVKLSKPKEVWEVFGRGDTTLPEYVTAHDIMSTTYESLKTTDYLEKAIDLFTYHHLLDIPVVDEDGDLAGLMNEEQLLKLALPEYILWLEDLSPILQFEPFVEVLKNEKTLRVAEVMSTEYATVPQDAPAIQVARVLMRREIRAVMVTGGKKLAGVITLSDFLTKVLRK